MSTADETSKDGKWNNDAHTALCTALAEALIAAGSSAAQKKELIMAVMRASGQNGFTWESIRQHLQKLRRKEGVSAAAGGSDSGAANTPSKRKRGAAPGSGVKKTPGSARGKKAAAAKAAAPLVIDSDDEDVKDESPSKKLKTEEAAESKVKEEYDDGLEDYMYPNEI